MQKRLKSFGDSDLILILLNKVLVGYDYSVLSLKKVFVLFLKRKERFGNT